MGGGIFVMTPPPNEIPRPKRKHCRPTPLSSRAPTRDLILNSAHFFSMEYRKSPVLWLVLAKKTSTLQTRWWKQPAEDESDESQSPESSSEDDIPELM